VANLAEVAYREPTIEFLSSFSLIDAIEAEPYYFVKYRLRNRLHQLSFATFNVAMRFETEESIQTKEY